MSEEKKLAVKIKFDGKELEFSGYAEEAIKFMWSFLSEHYPVYETIKKLTLTVNSEELLRELENIVAITPEEIVILIPKERLSDKEYVLLLLLKTYLEYQMSIGDDYSLSLGEISDDIGEPGGTVSGRLSELVSDGWVRRVARGRYEITLLGIKRLRETLIPDLQAPGG